MLLVRRFTLIRLRLLPKRTITPPNVRVLLWNPRNSVPIRMFSNENHSIDPLESNLPLYHEVSNETLNYLVEQFEEKINTDKIPGFDVREADGVLELNLGTKGIYVINKQTPNKQLWFSSPVSGPKRYNYDPNTKRWVNTRDGHDMIDLLSKELSKLLQQQIKL